MINDLFSYPPFRHQVSSRVFLLGDHLQGEYNGVTRGTLEEGKGEKRKIRPPSLFVHLHLNVGEI